MKLWAYTDGACAGNPGPGGWGAILIARDNNGLLMKERVLCGHEVDTTNNRMEMMAAIAALEALTVKSQITLKTDSRYLIDGITKWIKGWRVRNWQTKANQQVKNDDLWRRLSDLNDRHAVSWKWVKGHAGHPLNERVDQIAVEQRDIARRLKRDQRSDFDLIENDRLIMNED